MQSLDDPESERRARLARLAAGYREAARRALSFARRYREEEGPGGARERACILQARAWRQAAHDVRAGRPGLARARDAAAPSSKRAAG
jgi:hypothetical protein